MVPSVCLIKPHDMKAYGRVEVYLHAFLTSVHVGGFLNELFNDAISIGTTWP
jgi:hypothetical protein